MIDLEPQLLRVRCKWARRLDGVLSVKLSTTRLTPAGYVRTLYTAEQVGAIGVYSAALGRCFLIPIEEWHAGAPWICASILRGATKGTV